MKRRAAVHLDRRARVVGEDEDRRVEGRVGSPPAFPVGVVMPPGKPVLAGSHDLGADPDIVPANEDIVNAAGAARSAALLPPPAGLEHPSVQPLLRMAERAVAAQALTSAEAIERD